MMNPAELLASGVQLHRSGQLDLARQTYLDVLRQYPDHADALNLLGLADWQSGRFAEAAQSLERAVELDRTQAAFYANLGEAYRGLGRLDEAIAQYERALPLQPAAAVAHLRFGLLLEQAGLLDRAIASYRRAVELDDARGDAHGQLAQLLTRQGQAAGASRHYEKLVALQPNSAQGWLQLGHLRKRLGNLAGAEACLDRAVALPAPEPAAWFELGNIYQLEGRMDAAVVAYGKAIELNPSYAEAACNQGNALRELGRHDEAIAQLQRATEMRPDLAAAQSNLGAALQDAGRLAEAQAKFERAVQLEPGRPEFLFNLGTVLKDQGLVDEALAHYEQALAVDANYRQAVCSRGMARLSRGEFAAGWADYEQRVGLPQFDTLELPQPRWRGEPLGERRLLIHAEQGLGDTLQFIRYVPRVLSQAANVTIAVQPRLVRLLTESGYPYLVPREGPMPACDAHVPLLSLPMVLGTSLASIPADVPYLAASAERTEQWRQELARYDGLKVGIAWQGRPGYRGDRFRSLPLASFAPLAAVPGVRLFSLQKGPGSEQVAELGNRFELVDLGPRLDAEGAFIDTAGAIANLDLVITSDTAIAHLAGALGARVWVALAKTPDWRWMFDREDSPWYPTMRLFRQRVPGEWGEVFERMAAAVRELQPDAPSPLAPG